MQCKRVRIIRKSLAEFLMGRNTAIIVHNDSWCEGCLTCWFEFWKAHP